MRTTVIVLSLSLLGGCAQMDQFMPWLDAGAKTASQMGYGDQAQVASAIKQALDLGSQRATMALSAQGGYSKSGYRITLPQTVQPLASTLRQYGMGNYVDKVEASMNDAAEQAAGEALPVFQQAIKGMTVTDALGIVSGDQTAATQYFRAHTEDTLRARYAPIVESNLQKTGFYDQYKSMLAVYNALPLANKPNLDIQNYVIDQSLNAVYDRMGKEEALIRRDPVGRGTALISAVFGNSQASGQ